MSKVKTGEINVRGDDGLLYLEVSACIHGLDLQLQQALDRLRQRLLDLAHADAAAGLVHDVRLDQHLGKGVRLARATAAVCALVARRLQQRQRPFWGFDAQGRHQANR